MNNKTFFFIWRSFWLNGVKFQAKYMYIHINIQTFLPDYSIFVLYQFENLIQSMKLRIDHKSHVPLHLQAEELITEYHS